MEKINEIILFLFNNLFNKQADSKFDLKIYKKIISDEEINYNLTIKSHRCVGEEGKAKNFYEKRQRQNFNKGKEAFYDLNVIIIIQDLS